MTDLLNSLQSFQLRWLDKQRDALMTSLAALDGVRADTVQAMAAVPRELFVHKAFTARSYEDCALPIACGQTISQPRTVALMTSLLQPRVGRRMLEIGTGSGYQAAVLAALGCSVTTVERHEQLATQASDLLAALGLEADVRWGDGTGGLPHEGPWDGIIVTAGAPVVPSELTGQLSVGGRLVIPVGSRAEQELICIERISEDTFRHSVNGVFRFVPLIGAVGWQEGTL